MNVKCPACDRNVSELATACPYCRQEMPASEVAPKPPVSIIPGWHVRSGQVNTLGYHDGERFTEHVAPATVQLDVWTLARGVALGVVMGSVVSGFLWFVVYSLTK